MLKEICSDPKRVENYFKCSAINNSLLSAAGNPYWIKWKRDHPEAEKEEQRYFRIGSAVDCLLTDPKRWEEDFWIFNLAKPSGNMGIFLDNLPLYALNEENTPIYNDEGNIVAYQRNLSLYEDAYKKAKYKLPIGTVVQNFWSNDAYLGYYRAREQANGKIILSEDEMEEVENALEAIKANPYALSYFISEVDVEHAYLGEQGTESFTQVPIYWEEKGEPCKALLDFVLVNHYERKIYPGDLKTTISSPEDFEESFYKYGYYRQCAFYMNALDKSGILNEYISMGYTIQPFTFIVAPKKKNGLPAIIYKISKDTLLIGKYGGLANLYGKAKYMRGYQELLDAIIWHQEKDNYSAPKWLIEQDYTVTI